MIRILCLALLLIGCQEPKPPSATGRAYFQQGLEHAQDGRFHAAIAAYQQAAAQMPDAPQVHYNLANAYFLTDALDQAEAAYQKAITLKPDYADAYYQLGAVYIRQKKYEAAYAPLGKALESDPGYIAAYNALGLLHIRQGAYQEAADLYERALQVDSTARLSSPKTHYELWYHLGQVEVKRGEREAAKTAFAEAIRTDTTQAGAYAGLGALYVEERSYEEAEDLLLRAVALRPFWARPHYDLGQVYMRLGEREKGREVLERFARLEEEEKMIKSLEFTLLSEAEDAHRHYDLGVLYGQRRQFAKAAARYRRALELDSTFAAAYVNLGNIYLREERFAAAQQLFAQALAADSTHANAYNSLGNLHLMRRDFATAAATFASAVRLAPADQGFRENLEIARGLETGDERGP